MIIETERVKEALQQQLIHLFKLKMNFNKSLCNQKHTCLLLKCIAECSSDLVRVFHIGQTQN